ncbi:hypothetical protein K6I34_004721, partial [Streptomyces sp. UNOC14_S4]|nr:hypothetical protein [Streptomyces sp. UNOC14_S4]
GGGGWGPRIRRDGPVFHRPGKVTAATTAHCLGVMAGLGFSLGGDTAEAARTDILAPAVSGRHAEKGEQETRPVPLLAAPGPAYPSAEEEQTRAPRHAGPLAPEIIPHGFGQHTHKTRMRALRTPPKLIDEHLGHTNGSVPDLYDHVTPSCAGS